LFFLLALFVTFVFIRVDGTSYITDSVLSALFVFQAIFIFVPEETILFRLIKRSSFRSKNPKFVCDLISLAKTFQTEF
jgi:hypothetical protein